MSGSTFIQGGAGGILTGGTGTDGVNDVCKTLLFTLAETTLGIGTGGGGGGSGARGSTAPGGGGGGGGAMVWRRMSASEITGDTLSIIVGAAGVGGGMRNFPSSGQNGSSGGDTSFGEYVLADGGGAGGGGISGGSNGAAGNGRTITNSYPSGLGPVNCLNTDPRFHLVES